MVEYGVVLTLAGQPLSERLLSIDRQMAALLNRYHPDAVAIEELFFCKNVTTALLVGQARGVTILSAARTGVPVFDYKPMVIKQAITGYGKASKTQMQSMVQMLLNIEEIPKPDDAADAVAVAVCHLHNRRLADLIDNAD